MKQLRNYLQHLGTLLQSRRCTVCCEALHSSNTASPLPDAPPSASLLSFSSAYTSPVCFSCASLLKPRRSGYCPRCGELFADSSIPIAHCSSCLKTPPPWNILTFIAPYQDNMRELILQMKFNARLEYASLLGNMLACELKWQYRHNLPELIVPVPLYTRRLQQRGYNQSLELARPITGSMGIPLAPDAVQRIQATPPLAGMNKKQREQSLKGVFNIPAPETVAGKHILLVDDILTTGATLAHISRLLLAKGARTVDVAVAGRTPPP